jgi:energy-coupling factor transporter ATP-binding protein EcfA2
MITIAIAGLKGAGKDTLAQILATFIERDTPKKDGYPRMPNVAFADPIKRMAYQLGYPEEALWGPSEAREWCYPVTGVSARRFLQVMGTEVGRHLDPDFWVKIMEHHLDVLQRGEHTYRRTVGLEPMRRYGAPPIKPHAVFISDLRFPNENEALRRRERTMTVLVKRPQTETPDAHESEMWCRERAIREVDFYIQNDGSIPELIESAERIYNLAKKHFEVSS